jgi:hypothetical protein
MINVFELIGNVTRRIEPFHSEFLTVALRDNHLFRNRFLNLILSEQDRDILDYYLTSDRLEVRSEDILSENNRIDVVVKEVKSKHIIGVEVKTTDSSVSNNQLHDYYEKMIEKYPGYNICIVFLTPFNKSNLPEEVTSSQIHAILEFDNFHVGIKNSIHINWDEVVDLYDKSDSIENSVFVNHYRYIKEEITDAARLKKRMIDIERNRGLVEFFGESCVEDFYEKISSGNFIYTEDDQMIYFNIDDNINNVDSLLSAFTILMESGKLKKLSRKKNKVEEELLEAYESGTNGDFFKQFFSIVNSYKYLWLQGKGRIGVRATHDSYSSGVSVFTLNENSVQIRKYR